MKKYDFVVAIAAKTGLSKGDVEKMVDAMPEIITSEVRDGGDSVNLPGLGIFKQKTNPARTGRNPLTGAALEIPESKTIKFQPTSTMKKLV